MKVQVGALQEHESAVRQLAGQVDQAAGATGEAQALGEGAFGIVGQLVAVAIQGWITEATSAVKTISDTGHQIADGIKDTHTMISENEKYCTQLMTTTGEGL